MIKLGQTVKKVRKEDWRLTTWSLNLRNHQTTAIDVLKAITTTKKEKINNDR